MTVVAENVNTGSDIGLPNMPLKNLVDGRAINLDGDLFQAVLNGERPAVVKDHLGFYLGLGRTATGRSGLRIGGGRQDCREHNEQTNHRYGYSTHGYASFLRRIDYSCSA